MVKTIELYTRARSSVECRMEVNTEVTISGDTLR